MRFGVLAILIMLSGCVDSQNDRMRLVLAAAEGDEAAVARYLERVGSADFVSLKGETPLGNAAANGHLEIVRLLLDAGADASLRDAADRTAAEYAARNGHLAVHALLVSQNAEVR